MRKFDPSLEIILHEPEHSFRWARHDYPSHLAKWHFHPEYELHLIESSSGTMMIGDFIGSFAPGCLVLTGPHLPHNWISDTAYEGKIAGRDVLIQFTPEFADRLCDDFAELSQLRGILTAAAYGVVFYGETAREAGALLKAVGEASGIRRLVLFLEIMRTLTGNEKERSVLSHVAPALGIHSAQSKRLQEIVTFVQEHFRENLTLVATARLFNMEESAFSRYFRRSTGHTFVDFVNHQRIHFSCDLLSRTSKAITDICFEAGYNNTANFNRQFYRICRETPSEYRRRTQHFSQKGRDTVAAEESAA
ncbi:MULTISPECIES: helix-turn-helix domain-containing protein [unclassified Sinorhizobium]|uniref:helix-turn-helix domain-containing protein n=1 Tax=unclassified Sinorhizobium TaxID=2613772 RepID=UPI003523D281